MTQSNAAPRSRFGRRLAALVAAAAFGGLSLLTTGTASAEPNYPPAFNQILASKYNVCRGGKVAFKAQTFVAGSAVNYTVVVNSVTKASGSVTASNKGVAKKRITFNTSGVNRVTFSGTGKKGGSLVLTANITVTSKQCGKSSKTGAGGSGPAVLATSKTAAEGGGLPVTGGQITVLVLLGGGLLVGGVLLLVASRRSRA